MSTVDQAVEDGIGQGGVSDDLVPVIQGEMFQYTPFARRGSRIMARLEKGARQAGASMKSD